MEQGPKWGRLMNKARGRTQRHTVSAKVWVFVRNPDELANERAELARLLNKAGTCFLHETTLSEYRLRGRKSHATISCLNKGWLFQL